MLTVSSKLQYDQTRKERNLLQLEQTLNARTLETVSDRLATMKSDAKSQGFTDEQIKDTNEYQVLEETETALQVRADSIAAQLELLNDEMDNFLSFHQDGVKDATTFWCFGG